jgi:hypothetical protein
MPERQRLHQRRRRPRVARRRRPEHRTHHFVFPRHREHTCLVRQGLHRHDQSFHGLCLRRRRRAPPPRRRSRRRADTTKPRRASYRNGFPSRSASPKRPSGAGRGTTRCGPRGPDAPPRSPDAEPSRPGLPFVGSPPRSRCARDSRPGSDRRCDRILLRRIGSRSVPRRRPRARCARNLSRVFVPRHLRPVRVHARQKARGGHPGPSLFTQLADRLRRAALVATSRRSVQCPDLYGS